MRTLLAVVLLASCSSSPAPVEPVPLPPDPDEAAGRTSPTKTGPDAEDPIAPPKDDRAHAQGGKLADADGKPVDLTATWAETNVVVVFYRGSWCKICRKHLAELQASYKDLLHAGAHLYAVSTDDQAAGKQLATELGLQFPVLSDAGGNIARAWGVFDEGTGVAKPATFLISRGGAIALQQVGHSPSDQPGGYALLEQVKQHLSAEGSN